jgi:hypothetical protein
MEASRAAPFSVLTPTERMRLREAQGGSGRMSTTFTFRVVFSLNVSDGSSPAAYPRRSERRESARKHGVHGSRGEMPGGVEAVEEPEADLRPPFTNRSATVKTHRKQRWRNTAEAVIKRRCE